MAGTFGSRTSGLRRLALIVAPLIAVPLVATSGLAAAPAASAGRWTPAPPWGGGVFSISAGPSQVVYAGGDEGMVFRSSDGGQHWVRKTSLDAYSAKLVADPTSPDIVYAILGFYRAGGVGYIEQSMDGGSHWKELPVGPAPLQVASVAVDPAHPTHLLVGSGSGIYVSNDRGQRWTPVTGQVNGFTFAFLPASKAFPKGVILTAESYPDPVNRSIDGGLTWQPATTGLSVSWSSAVTYAGTGQIAYLGTSAGVDVSRDAAQHWQLLYGGLTGRSVYDISAVPGQPSNVLVSTDKGLFRTIGTPPAWHWVAGVPSSPEGRRGGLGRVTGSPHTLLVGTYGVPSGIYRSTNDGADWVWSSRGLSNLSFSGLAQLGTGPSMVLLAGTQFGNGLERSTDGGLTWQIVKSKVFDPYVSVPIGSPACSTVAYALYGGQAVRTRDGGATWQPMGPGLPEVGGDYGSMAVDPSTCGHAYLPLRGIGVYRTLNGGASWTLVKADPQGQITGAAAYGNTVVTAQQDGVFLSRDNGKSWKNTHVPRGWAAFVAVSSDGVVYALNSDFSGENTTLQIRNASGWRSIASPIQLDMFSLTSPLSLDPLSPSTVYVVGYGVARSTDHGTTFTQLMPAPTHVQSFLPVQRSGGITLLAGTSRGLFRYQP